jgi:hypothetical protein
MFFLVILLFGCEGSEDSGEPINPPETLKYIVKASADHGKFTPEFAKVSQGGSISLELILDPGYESDSIYVNGVHFPHLSGKTSFTFSNIDGDFNVKSVTKINNWGRLIQNPWKVTKFQRWNKNTMNLELDLRPPNIDEDLVTFFTNSSGDWMKTVNPTWKTTFQVKLLEDSTLTIKYSDDWKIVELEQGKILAIEFFSPFASPDGPDPTKDSIVRITYEAIKQ